MGLGGLGGDLVENQRSKKINESAEDTVILLHQFSCLGFTIFNQFKSIDIGFKCFNVNHL